MRPKEMTMDISVISSEFGERVRNNFRNLSKMTRLKEIISGIKSCFTLTSNERLIILIILALFIIGLGLRWRHLSRERADPDFNESRDEQTKSEISDSQK